MIAAKSRSASLILRGGLVALLVVLPLVLVAPTMASTQATVAFSNVHCYTSGPMGYSLTMSGSGFDPNTNIVVFFFDNLDPGPAPAGQFELILTDATGAFSFDFAGGPAQSLPVVLEATDPAFNLLAGPVSTGDVTCEAPPPPPPPPPPVVPTTVDQCKNDGWATFPGFSNQGQCVSYVNHLPS
jgi:hypothetical protein